MYIIEHHTKHSAHAIVVVEKGDDKKTYEQFAQHRLITNHAGDVNDATCKWCAQRRKSVIAL